MTTTTQQKLEEALDIYGIVRNGKKPSIGIANIESDDLFNDLLALIAEEVRVARIDAITSYKKVNNLIEAAELEKK